MHRQSHDGAIFGVRRRDAALVSLTTSLLRLNITSLVVHFEMNFLSSRQADSCLGFATSIRSFGKPGTQVQVEGLGDSRDAARKDTKIS